MKHWQAANWPLVLFALTTTDSSVAAGPRLSATANKSSDWFHESRFGLRYDWGLQAIGFNDQLDSLEPSARSVYRKRLGQFRGERFDAKSLVAIAIQAGARFVIAPARLPDGFCLFNAAATDFDVMATPMARDVVADLARECKAQGVRFGIQYSIADGRLLAQPSLVSASADPPQVADPPFLTMVGEQLRDLCTAHQTDLLLIDGADWIKDEAIRSELGKIIAMLRKLRPEMLIDVGTTLPGDLRTFCGCCPWTTANTAADPSARWASVVEMNPILCVTSADERDEKQPRAPDGHDLIQALIDIASRGGNMLLSVPLAADGSLAPIAAEPIHSLTSWMFKNREAIYATSSNPFGRLPFHGRVTTSGTRLNVFIFDWPKDGALRLPGLTTLADSSRLLVGGSNLTIKSAGSDVLISGLPAEAPDPAASVIVVDLANAPKVEPLPIKPDHTGVLELPAVFANLHGTPGRQPRLYPAGEGFFIGRWNRVEDAAQWEFLLDRNGTYSVTIDYACSTDDAGSIAEIVVDAKRLQMKVLPTKGPSSFESSDVGNLELDAGAHVLVVKAKKLARRRLMDLRAVRLTRRAPEPQPKPR